jgi:hypothetical protein
MPRGNVSVGRSSEKSDPINPKYLKKNNIPRLPNMDIISIALGIQG